MTSLYTSAAIVTRIGAARLLATEITRTTSALRLDIDPYADQRRFVGIDQVGQSAHFHDVGARSFTGKVLYQTLVDADHGDVDPNLSFNLNQRQDAKTRVNVNLENDLNPVTLSYSISISHLFNLIKDRTTS